MAINKSGWDTSVKVSQKTIDEIKKMGMSKALKTVAGASKASGQDASAKAWVEGVKRLYGANRVAAATKSTPKASSSSYPSPSSAGSNSASKPKVNNTGGPKSISKPAASKPSTPKKSTTSNPFTALHNAVSPYGNKNQSFKSPISGGGVRKSVPGKPSIGEQINSAIGSVGKALKPNRMTPAQVRAEMARRQAAAKKK